MKIVGVEVLQNCGRYASSKEWRTTRAMLHDAVKRVSWPPGAKRFTIYPESGKKSGEGNGVKPIKNELMQELGEKGWKLEEPLGVAILKRPGKLDAVLYTSYGPVALEWETGNISSSHRALNKNSHAIIPEERPEAGCVARRRRTRFQEWSSVKQCVVPLQHRLFCDGHGCL